MGISGSEIKRNRERREKEKQLALEPQKKSFVTKYKEASAANVAKDQAKLPVCINCGFQGKPKRKTRGSILIEIVLWLAFIIPGLIYSLWRVTSRHNTCPLCGSPNIIPAASPMAQKILNS